MVAVLRSCGPPSSRRNTHVFCCFWPPQAKPNGQSCKESHNKKLSLNEHFDLLQLLRLRRSIFLSQLMKSLTLYEGGFLITDLLWSVGWREKVGDRVKYIKVYRKSNTLLNIRKHYSKFNRVWMLDEFIAIQILLGLNCKGLIKS